MRAKTLVAAAGTAVTLAATASHLLAQAVTQPMPAPQSLISLYNKTELALSFTTVILNANIRVDGTSSGGTEVDAEDDLGLEQVRIEPRIAARWRPHRRHELEVGYQFARRGAEKTVERQFTFRDSTYNVGANIQATMNTDQAFLNYRFAFTAKPDAQLGATLGLGALFPAAGVHLMGTGGNVQFSQAATIPAPIGAVGLFGRKLLGTRWLLESDLRVLALGISRFDIRVLDFNVATRYALSPRFQIETGVGGSGVKIDVAPRTLPSGDPGVRSGVIKYSMMNVRAGLVFVP